MENIRMKCGLKRLESYFPLIEFYLVAICKVQYYTNAIFCPIVLSLNYLFAQLFYFFAQFLFLLPNFLAIVIEFNICMNR